MICASNPSLVKVAARLCMLALGAAFIVVASRAVGGNPTRGHGCCDDDSRVNGTCGNKSDSGTPFRVVGVYFAGAATVAGAFAKYGGVYSSGDSTYLGVTLALAAVGFSTMLSAVAYDISTKCDRHRQYAVVFGAEPALMTVMTICAFLYALVGAAAVGLLVFVGLAQADCRAAAGCPRACAGWLRGRASQLWRETESAVLLAANTDRPAAGATNGASFVV